MENRKALDKRYEAIAWGIGLVWLGFLGLVPGDQNGLGMLSIGLILLALNLVRFLNKLPINGFSLVLGILASALGLMALFRQALGYPPVEVDFFALMLIVIGLYILIPAPKREENGLARGDLDTRAPDHP